MNGEGTGASRNETCEDRKRPKAPRWLIMGVALISAPVVALVGLRLLGLLQPMHVGNPSMEPTLRVGDVVLVEGFSRLMRAPRRGELVVFGTDGIRGLPSGGIWLKRVAGLPREHLQISNSAVWIDGVETVVGAAGARVRYESPPGTEKAGMLTDFQIPEGSFVVLGDNATRSFDSRFFGYVPEGNVLGRAMCVIWPPGRIGCSR